MAENGHYWQIEGESATAENIDIVLSDLTQIVEDNIAEEHHDVVKFIPGEGGEKGHFELGEGGSQVPPINAIVGEVLIGDGHDWAVGNAIDLKLMKRSVSNASIGSFGTFSSQFETDQVNCFSFFSMKSGVEPTIFVIDKGSKLAMGKSVVHDYEEGVWDAPTFWDTEIPYPRLIMDGAAQIMMQPKDGKQMPIIQMDGGAILRFNYNREQPYYEPCTNVSANDNIRRYEDPFGLVKNNSYTSSGIPIFSMHDNTTFQMQDSALIQAKNGSQTILQGNARVHISGGQWSNGYHAKISGTVVVLLYKTGQYSSTDTITFSLSSIYHSKELNKLFKDFNESSYSSSVYDDALAVYNKLHGATGVTITFNGVTEEEFIVPSNFRSAKVTDFTITGGNEYTDTVNDFEKKTDITIGPNSIIRMNNDQNSTGTSKRSLISVEPSLVKIGVGNDSGGSITNPNYYGAYGKVGSLTYVTNTDFPINKTIEKRSYSAADIIGDMATNIPDPYFEIGGGSAIKTGVNSLFLRDTDGQGNALIDDIMVQGASAYTKSTSCVGTSNVKVYENFNQSNAVDNLFILGDYSKDLTFSGKTLIKFGPLNTGNRNMMFGVDMSGNNTDIVGHWEKFQAILSGNDSFIQWDGNNHFESWSGTQIFRASNPNVTKTTGTYYPKFTLDTGSQSETKTVEINKDLSNYTNQQIIDEFGTQLIPAKPADVWNKQYDNPVLTPSGIQKTLIGNTYVQSIDLQVNSAKEVWMQYGNAYVYSDTNYSDATSALNNATIKELVGRALNIGGTWNYVSTPSYTHTWDSTVGKYKLRFYSRNIVVSNGMKLLLPSTGTTTPSDFNLPANTTYSSMTEAQRALMDKAMSPAGNKIYDANGNLLAWAEGGSYYNKGYIKTASNTNYSVSQTGSAYSVTATSSISWTKTQHMGKDWFGPIQTADRVGSLNWEKGPITQMYGPVNFLMREKWTADNAHTKTYTLTSSETYDVSNQAQAIADFEANATDYAAFEAYLTQEGYTLWDIISIATATGGYTITFSICEAGWKPHIDSYPDNPVVEITDGSELRLYGGVKVKGETEYGVTTFTFSGTQTEGEVSFTLDELRMLKTLVGSVRTAVVNDPSEAVELGTLYFIDEGGNA